MNIKRNWIQMLSILFATLLLASCGGSGGAPADPGATDPNLVWDQGNWDQKNWQ